MDFLTVFERVGVPLGILIFFAVGVWRVLKWLGERVVTPITASHISLVESAKKTNETNSQTLEQMTKLLEANDSRDQATYNLVVETHQMVKGFKGKE